MYVNCRQHNSSTEPSCPADVLINLLVHVIKGISIYFWLPVDIHINHTHAMLSPSDSPDNLYPFSVLSSGDADQLHSDRS